MTIFMSFCTDGATKKLGRRQEELLHLISSAFIGWLVTDGYGAYNSYEKRQHCLAHLIRKAFSHSLEILTKCIKPYPITDGMTLAAIAPIIRTDPDLDDKQTFENPYSLSHNQEQWEPCSSSYYNGELIVQPRQRWTWEQQLELLDNHPMFTGKCPSCGA